MIQINKKGVLDILGFSMLALLITAIIITGVFVYNHYQVKNSIKMECYPLSIFECTQCCEDKVNIFYEISIEECYTNCEIQDKLRQGEIRK